MRISFTSVAGFTALSLLSGVYAHVSLAQVPMELAAQSHTEIIIAITQTLSLYGLALDLKNWDDLNSVYTENAVANLGRGPIKGRPALLDYYKKNQGNVPTHHVSGNIYVKSITQTTAKVTSDAVATLFGDGPKYPGTNILLLSHEQIEAFYERFDDEFVKGADGLWRIKKRELTLIVWRIFYLLSSLYRDGLDADFTSTRQLSETPLLKTKAVHQHSLGCCIANYGVIRVVLSGDY